MSMLKAFSNNGTAIIFPGPPRLGSHLRVGKPESLEVVYWWVGRQPAIGPVLSIGQI